MQRFNALYAFIRTADVRLSVFLSFFISPAAGEYTSFS
jgi:hypothetical protein